MNEQASGQTSPLRRPTTNNREDWKAYWEQQNQPWRCEPEINIERQKYLNERRTIAPDVLHAIFPFKGVSLSRADIEWLLATHDNGRGPVDWSTESRPDPYQARKGLDLRGADLRKMDLRDLPLTRLMGDSMSYGSLTDAEREPGTIHLEGAFLVGAHLEGAALAYSHLEEANLYGAYLEKANLSNAHLEKAMLNTAHLEMALLSDTHLEGAALSARMEGTKLFGARLDNAKLWAAYLKSANLCESHLEGTDLTLAHLESAYLARCFLDDTTKLDKVFLGNTKDGFSYLVDIHWRGVNLAVVDWSSVPVIGDEPVPEKRKWIRRKQKASTNPNKNYTSAIRAYRQLAVVLRDQGLNEDAARFAYRAQLMQRMLFREQRKFGQYLFSLFLDLLAGYGYKPIRSFAAYLLVIVTFATAYYIIGHTAGPLLSPLGAFVFSMTSFHGRGFFPGGIKLDDPLTVVAALEAFVGLLIEVTFIATLTQRLFGK